MIEEWMRKHYYIDGAEMNRLERIAADDILEKYLEARQAMRWRWRIVGPRTAFMFFLQGYLSGVRKMNEAAKEAGSEPIAEPMTRTGDPGTMPPGAMQSGFRPGGDL